MAVTNTQLLLAPIFVHVLWTVWIGRQSLRARIAAVRSGETKLSDIAVDTKAWPDRVRALGNNFDSQFDMPMVWYAACALLLATGLADGVAAALSWAYLALRVAHSYVHTGSNDVPLRMRIFVASYAALVALWMWFGIRLYVIG